MPPSHTTVCTESLSQQSAHAPVVTYQRWQMRRSMQQYNGFTLLKRQKRHRMIAGTASSQCRWHALQASAFAQQFATAGQHVTATDEEHEAFLIEEEEYVFYGGRQFAAAPTTRSRMFFNVDEDKIVGRGRACAHCEGCRRPGIDEQIPSPSPHLRRHGE